MKIRIQDNSIRFRITVRELEELAERGELMRTTTFPTGTVFSYGIRVKTEAAQSSIDMADGAIVAVLSAADLDLLRDDSREGVYCRTEAAEERARFIFFVEKDRPGATCEKPEHWIYEEHAGKPASFRPIQPADK
jgi:hypothetical protein